MKKNILKLARSICNLKHFSLKKFLAIDEDSLLRKEYEKLLVNLVETKGTKNSLLFPGNVLVDATFDNPNYWFRYGLFRTAIGDSNITEFGLIGKYSRRATRLTLKRFGVNEIIDGRFSYAPFLPQAKKLIVNTRTASEIITWNLPFSFPGELLYDGLLKRQRTATIDLSDPNLEDYVAEALSELDHAHKIIQMREWSLFYLSHAANFQYAALAWLAVINKIPVIVGYGHYGTPRYWRINEKLHIYNSNDPGSNTLLDSIKEPQATLLQKIGDEYLNRRRSGLANDVGALYSYKKKNVSVTKGYITKFFSWDIDKPLITVYASNWFDFPHLCGMKNYTDFLEWINVTITSAKENQSVNWLFRAHPCDDWYGGLRLKDIFEKYDLPDNIRLSPTDWEGSSVMMATDSVVTFHGTIGIEASSIRKPVLVADSGWYHDCGFVVHADSQHQYIEYLSKEWWLQLDLNKAYKRSTLYAGLYFCVPDWQEDFILDDDYLQAALYPISIKLLNSQLPIIDKEITTIRNWLSNNESLSYHLFKMINATNYSFSNVAN